MAMLLVDSLDFPSGRQIRSSARSYAVSETHLFKGGRFVAQTLGSREELRFHKVSKF